MMKKKWSLALLILTAATTGRSQQPPEELLLDYLRQHVTTNQVDMVMAATRASNANRKVVFALGLRDDPESHAVLLACLSTNANPWARFYCTVAPAARKDTNAAPVLRGVFTGETPVQSSSCFEVSVAGLALIVLGQDPPESFSFKTVPNPLLPQLEGVRNKKPKIGTEPSAPGYSPPADGRLKPER